MHNPFARHHAVAQQFRLHLAQPLTLEPGSRNGQQLARLIAHNPRVVQLFDDHASVARRLLASGEVETLCRVVASGLLHGLALQVYRLAIDAWLSR
jgi:hypothetical protein